MQPANTTTEKLSVASIGVAIALVVLFAVSFPAHLVASALWSVLVVGCVKGAQTARRTAQPLKAVGYKALAVVAVLALMLGVHFVSGWDVASALLGAALYLWVAEPLMRMGGRLYKRLLHA